MLPSTTRLIRDPRAFWTAQVALLTPLALDYAMTLGLLCVLAVSFPLIFLSAIAENLHHAGG